jgi:hypothetical protein
VAAEEVAVEVEVVVVVVVVVVEEEEGVVVVAAAAAAEQLWVPQQKDMRACHKAGPRKLRRCPLPCLHDSCPLI